MPRSRARPEIVEEIPERVVVETDASMPAYLVLSDTFDPGWSATVDGRPAPIRPAYVAFRAVYLPAGTHTVVFTYRPAGFELGLALSGCGIAPRRFSCWFRPRSSVASSRAGTRGLELARRAGGHGGSCRWEHRARFGLGHLSSIPAANSRWINSVHRHTWGAGIAAMKANRM